jgi:hypothetical protein
MTFPQKVLADIANTMPHMVVGRMHPEDFETLATLTDGTLTMDLLAAMSRHSSGGTLNLKVTGELASWLNERLAKMQLSPTELSSAELAITIRTARVATDRARIVPFDFVCTGTFSTNDRSCSSKPTAALRWYNRSTGSISD